MSVGAAVVLAALLFLADDATRQKRHHKSIGWQASALKHTRRGCWLLASMLTGSRAAQHNMKASYKMFQDFCKLSMQYTQALITSTAAGRQVRPLPGGDSTNAAQSCPTDGGRVEESVDGTGARSSQRMLGIVNMRCDLSFSLSLSETFLKGSTGQQRALVGATSSF